MKTIILIICTITCFLHASVIPGVEPPDPPVNNHDDLIALTKLKFIGTPKEIEHHMANPPSTAKIAWVKPEYKKEVITFLRAEIKTNKEYESAIYRALVGLGDENSIEEVIQKMKAKDRQAEYDFFDNINRENIKFVVPLIYEGDASANKFGQPFWMHAASKLLASIVVDNDKISKDVNHWAYKISLDVGIKYKRDEHLRWLVLQWWEHNRIAILAKNYEEVKWLPTFKGKLDYADGEFKNDPDYLVYDNKYRNDILPISAKADLTFPEKKNGIPSPASSATNATDSSHSKTIILLGIISAILSAIFLMQRKAS